MTYEELVAQEQGELNAPNRLQPDGASHVLALIEGATLGAFDVVTYTVDAGTAEAATFGAFFDQNGLKRASVQLALG